MKTKRKYLSPQLAVALFKAERGYATSGFRLAIFTENLSEGSENIEERQESGDIWGSEWNY